MSPKTSNEWEKQFDREWYLFPIDDHSRNIQQEIKSFISSLLRKEKDLSFQEGYKKGRIRCLEQHRQNEMDEWKKRIAENLEMAMLADAFVGFSDEEWRGAKKILAITAENLKLEE